MHVHGVPKKNVNFSFQASLREGKWRSGDSMVFPSYTQGIRRTGVGVRDYSGRAWKLILEPTEEECYIHHIYSHAQVLEVIYNHLPYNIDISNLPEL